MLYYISKIYLKTNKIFSMEIIVKNPFIIFIIWIKIFKLKIISRKTKKLANEIKCGKISFGKEFNDRNDPLIKNFSDTSKEIEILLKKSFFCNFFLI